LILSEFLGIRREGLTVHEYLWYNMQHYHWCITKNVPDKHGKKANGIGAGNMYLEEAVCGMTFTAEPVCIEKEKMLAFAHLYDPIPLHMDEEYAKNTRYGDLIAPGVMSFMAVWAKVTELGLFEDSLVAGKSTRIEWHLPVYAGDVLTGKCEITQVIPRNAYNGIVELMVEVYNQRGELVLTNWTESVVKYKVPRK